MGDPYVDPRSGVLRNRLGITDEDELRAAEADITAAALFQLEMAPHLGEGHFDFVHLRALHVHLFGEIYSWAGRPRTVDIAKGSWFCLARNIDEFATSVFRELADENYLVGLDRPDLARRVAALYGQLNALHPFREGNGRTQRAFLTALGRLGGWRVRWSELDAVTNNEASARSLERGDDAALAEMFDFLLEEVPVALELAGTRRRVVLAIPEVAVGLAPALEQVRAGPYPREVTCPVCSEEYALVASPTVVRVQPMPELDPGIVTCAHARCDRSRVLPPPSARQIREWRVRRTEPLDATALAFVVAAPFARAALAWRTDDILLKQAGDDVIDPFLGTGLRLGLRPVAAPEPPDERTPGWSVTVDVASSAVTVKDPRGKDALVGRNLDLSPEWVDAVATTGECALFLVSRGDVDVEGLARAGRQGRLVAGLAEAALRSD